MSKPSVIIDVEAEDVGPAPTSTPAKPVSQAADSWQEAVRLLNEQNNLNLTVDSLTKVLKRNIESNVTKCMESGRTYFGFRYEAYPLVTVHFSQYQLELLLAIAKQKGFPSIDAYRTHMKENSKYIKQGRTRYQEIKEDQKAKKANWTKIEHKYISPLFEFGLYRVEDEEEKQFVVKTISKDQRLGGEEKVFFDTKEQADDYIKQIIDNSKVADKVFVQEEHYLVWFENHFKDYYELDAVKNSANDPSFDELSRRRKKVKAALDVLKDQVESSQKAKKIAPVLVPQSLSFLGFIATVQDSKTGMEKSGSNADIRSYLYKAAKSSLKMPLSFAGLDSFVDGLLSAIKHSGPLKGIEAEAWDEAMQLINRVEAKGNGKIPNSSTLKKLNVGTNWWESRLAGLRSISTAYVSYKQLFPYFDGFGQLVEAKSAAHLRDILLICRGKANFPPFTTSEFDALFHLKKSSRTHLGQMLTMLVAAFGWRAEEIRKFQDSYTEHLDFWFPIEPFGRPIKKDFSFHFKYLRSHYDHRHEAMLIGCGKPHKVFPPHDVDVPVYLSFIFRALLTNIKDPRNSLGLKLKAIDNDWVKYTKTASGSTDSRFKSNFMRNFKATGISFIVFSDNPDQDFRFKTSAGVYTGQSRAGHKRPSMTVGHYATSREDSAPLDIRWCIRDVPFRYYVLPHKVGDTWLDLLSNHTVYDAILLTYLCDLLKTYTPKLWPAYREEIYKIWAAKAGFHYSKYDEETMKRTGTPHRGRGTRTVPINSPNGRKIYLELIKEFKIEFGDNESYPQKFREELWEATGLAEVQRIIDSTSDADDIAVKVDEAVKSFTDLVNAFSTVVASKESVDRGMTADKLAADIIARRPMSRVLVQQVLSTYTNAQNSAYLPQLTENNEKSQITENIDEVQVVENTDKQRGKHGD